MKLAEWFSAETIRAGAMPMPNNPAGRMGTVTQKPQGAFPQDNSDLDQNQQPGQDPTQDPALTAAPYVKLLTKLGYEYQGSDEDVNGQPIGQSFQGQDGDMIMVKPDSSWVRFGPGAQRSQGPDINSLGQNLVKGALSQGDDQDHHSALRQAGYNKIHKDDQGNTYYKHPQTGNTVTVTKDGKWNSSTGSGRGAGKLRGFLGDEQMQQQDPQMQKMKLQQQQMKQQQQMQRQQGMMKPKVGTRGMGSTRPKPPMGGGGGF
jgi:hypothetical protein